MTSEQTQRMSDEQIAETLTLMERLGGDLAHDARTAITQLRTDLTEAREQLAEARAGLERISDYETTTQDGVMVQEIARDTLARLSPSPKQGAEGDTEHV